MKLTNRLLMVLGLAALLVVPACKKGSGSGKPISANPTQTDTTPKPGKRPPTNVSTTPRLKPQPRPKGTRKVKFVAKRALPAVLGTLLFAPDGKHAAVVGYSSITYCRLSDGQVLFEPQLAGAPGAISPDGRYLCCANRGVSGRGRLKIFDLTTGALSGSIVEGSDIRYTCLAFSKDGRFLYTNGTTRGSGELYKWDFKKKKIIWKQVGDSLMYMKLYPDPHGKWLICTNGAPSQKTEIRDPATGSLIQTIGDTKMRARLDKGYLACSQKGRVDLFDTADWRHVGGIALDGPVHEGKLQYTTWRHWQEKRLLVGWTQRRVIFRDDTTFKVVGELLPPAPMKWIWGAQFTPDDKTLLISTEKTTMFGTIEEIR